jgi:CRP/FNR family transcriptional regulator
MNSSLAFLQQFEPKLISDIEKCSKRKEVKSGDVLLNYGQLILYVPIVIKGTLKIYRTDDKGAELLLYYINAEESCAMTFTCCMEEKASEIKAIVEDDGEILMLPIEKLDYWIQNYPKFRQYSMSTIQLRFEELLKTIDSIAFQKLDVRLIQYLKEKQRIADSSLINLSHEQIAQELATSRVVVSRLLKKLEQNQKILLYRNQIKILGAL